MNGALNDWQLNGQPAGQNDPWQHAAGRGNQNDSKAGPT